MRHPAFVVLVVLLSLWAPLALAGQEVTESLPASTRVATLTGGVGNTMGWFGLQGERYFAGERLSLFLGAGYTPEIDPGIPTGPTFALGIRGFTAGLKHRGFLALSLSQLFVEQYGNSRRFYGPGLEAGYQFASRGGFTIMAALGLGYAPGVPEHASKVGGMAELGLGYTWLRQ